MEFTYKLTEAEYLLACGIPIKKPGPLWPRLLRYAYFVAPLIIVWGAFFGGMVLERSELMGVSVEIHKLPPIGPMVSVSFFPSVIYAWLVLLLTRAILSRSYRRRRLSHFRGDPGCQAETTVNATLKSISFRSATGSSESVWDCYETWAERSGVLLLITRAGARKIVKISSLSADERQELHGILAAMLPRI